MNRRTHLSDYDRIAQSFAWLEAARGRCPGWSEMAASAGLSEADYRALLQTWSGVSPERLPEILKPDHLRRILRQSGELPGEPGSAPSVGRTGQAQLVELDAISSRGAADERTGRVIAYGAAMTPYGTVAVGFTWRGVCHLSFLAGAERAEQALRAAWPGMELTERQAAAEKLLDRIFSAPDGDAPEPLRAWVVGTEFQVRVWQALLALPSGHLWSYAELAARAGRPGAARAVGSAMATNPLPMLIPCHRVLRQNGEVGRYGGGSVRKALMIAREVAQLEGVD